MEYVGYIGTYTKGDSEGIYSFTLNTETKKISGIKPVAKLDNPTYVTVSQNNQYLYSVIKEGDAGGVAAYKIESETLQLINKEISDGASPCHISVDRNNNNVVTANYHLGTIDSYLTSEQGGVNPSVSTIALEGTGPNKKRQEKPHTHYSGFTPDERYVVAVDLGIDQLLTYSVDNGVLKEVNRLHVKPGSGPRHIVFHPNGKYAYIMTELSNEVITLAYNPEDGSFKDLQYVSAIPSNFTENSQGSAIHISSDGNFIYAANRGHDSIAVFEVNQGTGELTFIEHMSTGGNWPRDFILDPTETFLIATNQESSNLVLFSRDKNTGKLTKLDSEVKVPDPVCVKFLNY